MSLWGDFPEMYEDKTWLENVWDLLIGCIMILAVYGLFAVLILAPLYFTALIMLELITLNY